MAPGMTFYTKVVQFIYTLRPLPAKTGSLPPTWRIAHSRAVARPRRAAFPQVKPLDGIVAVLSVKIRLAARHADCRLAWRLARAPVGWRIHQPAILTVGCAPPDHLADQAASHSSAGHSYQPLRQPLPTAAAL
jgi:hypothetical protein